MRMESVRDDKGHLIGTKTIFDNGDVVARDSHGQILGRSSERFGITCNSNGHLVSRNQADANILLRWK